MINVNKRSIVILSGACCNPSLKSLDIKTEAVFNEAAKTKGIEITMKTVSIASAAIGGLGGFGEKVGAQIRESMREKGMSALPIIFVDGNLVSSGVVPNLEEAFQMIE